MNKFLLFAPVIYLFSLTGLFGQTCDARAATLSLSTTTFCVGDTIYPIGSNANLSAGYANELIVVDGTGVIIQTGITTGAITNLPGGNYGVHSYNYQTVAPPQEPPQVGSRITDVMNPLEDCYDISAILTFTVLDTVAPIAVCTSQEIVLNLDENGQAILPPALVDDGSRDDCGIIAAYTLSKELYTCADIGTAAVVFKVIDTEGQLDSCTATLRISDTNAPEPACQDVTVYTDVNGLALLSIDEVDAGSMDICTEVTRRSLSEDRFTCGQGGDNLVWLYLEDGYGNIDSCSSTITVLDTLAPVLRCQDQQIHLDESGLATLAVRDVDTGTTDNCGSLDTLELSQTYFNCTDLGMNAVVLFARDNNGNADSCQVTIEVIDPIAPEASCRDFTLALGTDGAALLTPDLINQQSSDNCGIARFEMSQSSFSCADLGINTVVLTVFDQGNNSDSCLSRVTVVDLNKPEVLTQNIQVELDSSGMVTVRPEAIDAGSYDNCAIDSIWLSQNVFDCSDTGPNLIRLYVQDVGGNINDRAAVIEVIDNQQPVLVCPENVVITTDLDGMGGCEVVIPDAQFDPLVASDNCSLDTLFHDYDSSESPSSLMGARFSPGVTTITWSLADADGLEQSCQFEVQVIDNEAPVARCKDTLMVQLGPNGLVSLDSSLLDNGSSDNCGIVSYRLSQTDLYCEQVGYHEITVELLDAAGNQDSCSVVVGVIGGGNCPAPAISNSMDSNAVEPCSCRGDGAFDEQIIIGPTTKNQVWTVKSSSLLDVQRLLPVSSGTPFTEVPISADSSVYVLSGIHLDGEGYTITAESPMFEDLTFSNICYYPAPEILGLEGPICLFTNPIPLEVYIPNEVEGQGYFTVNGLRDSVINPLALGIGQHEIAYHFDAGNPAGLNPPDHTGCAVVATRTIDIAETSSYIACNNMLNISSNVSCEILVKPQMILSGNYLCYDDYQVFLAFDGQAIPNPAPAEYAGKTLQALVQHKVSGQSCTGNISIKDVTGPQVIACAPEITDRFICTDLDSILNNPASIVAGSKFYTGLPVVEDNCTGTLLEFEDILLQNQDCSSQEVQTIRREFRVADQFGNTNACEQLITFHRPAQVYFPGDTILKLGCDVPVLATDDAGNLSPSVTGAPYVLNGFGEPISLVDYRLCGYYLFYEDQKIDICSAQEALIRTWRLYDECAGAYTRVVTQYVEYGDFDAPEVSCPALDLNNDGRVDAIPVYNTSPANCLASIELPQPRVKECSAYTIQTKIHTWQTVDRFGFPLREPVFIELPNVSYVGGTAQGVPAGEHYFVFTVTDACNNITRDTCMFQVVDRVPPVALCRDYLSVALSHPGTPVFTTDIDAGSRDNCDLKEVGLEIRRLIAADCSSTGSAAYSDWGDSVELTCCDVNKLVSVELKVTDQLGNKNQCTSRIRVVDNLAPTCQAPFNISINCDELPAGFDVEDKAQLQQSFGIPRIADNCAASWVELDPVVDTNNCGVGFIRRYFEVVDQAGNTSRDICQQLITIEAVFDYSLRFPADSRRTCATLQQDTVQFFEKGCDVISVNVTDSEYQDAAGACHTIERVYRVINWCEYDGAAAPVIVPRDADCDKKPGDEDVWVHVTRAEITYLDRNNNPYDAIPAAGVRGTSCDGATNRRGYWKSSAENTALQSSGFWQYTQYIRVVDEQPPVVAFDTLPPFCSENLACTAEVVYPFTVSEDCSLGEINASVIVDLDDDGAYDFVITHSEMKGTYPDYRIEATLPLGQHRFYLKVRDACGNPTEVEIPFTVVDCLPPTPICGAAPTVELRRMDVPTDVNSDGQLDMAIVSVAATALISLTTNDCSGPVSYSINRVGEPASQEQNILKLTCSNEGIVPVEIHAWDVYGNHDYCNTFIEVQNTTNACQEIVQGAIHGQIMTESRLPVNAVEVSLSGPVRRRVFTDPSGSFSFPDLPDEGGFKVMPALDGDDPAGISTYDLILIRKHILGMEQLDSPYKLIAADANNSGSISVLDLIQLQKLILGVEVELSENTSWRFVAADYRFPNPSDPFAVAYPTVINYSRMDRGYYDANFIAIKIGDVNNSVNPGNLQALEPRSGQSAVMMDIADAPYVRGSIIEVPVQITELDALIGFQFGLSFDRERLRLLELLPGQLSAANFGQFPDRGLVTGSWYRTEEDVDSDQPLFVLRFEVLVDAQASDLFQLDHRRLQPEAYTWTEAQRPIQLRFNEQVVDSEDFRLLQNWPNPAREGTNLSWILPKGTPGVLKVLDHTGRIIWQQAGDFPAGWNKYRLVTENFPSGVLYYQFESRAYQATRKMVVIKP